MRDTAQAIERKFHEMLMKRSGEERLKMGCSMHATAQALAKASLRQRYRNANPGQLKPLLFLYFYATDFEPEKRKRIAAALARRSRLGNAPEGNKPAARIRSDRTNLASVRFSGPDFVQDKAETYGKKRNKKGKRSRQWRI